jgi:hypothetical protein
LNADGADQRALTGFAAASYIGRIPAQSSGTYVVGMAG